MVELRRSRAAAEFGVTPFVGGKAWEREGHSKVVAVLNRMSIFVECRAVFPARYRSAQVNVEIGLELHRAVPGSRGMT